MTQIPRDLAKQLFEKSSEKKPIKVKSEPGSKPVRKKSGPKKPRDLVPTIQVQPPTANYRQQFEKVIKPCFIPGKIDYQVVYASGPYFIPGQVISSKRGKEISDFYQKDGSTKRGLRMSDEALAYKAATKLFYAFHAYDFRKAADPMFQEFGHLEIGLFFLRTNNAMYDYQNMAQLPLDLMQEHHWIAGDDTKIMTPHYLGEKIVGAGNEGVHIYLMRKIYI